MNKTTEVFESENSNYSSTSVERALKLAEEALEKVKKLFRSMTADECPDDPYISVGEALAAIREALAEPVKQEPVCNELTDSEREKYEEKIKGLGNAITRQFNAAEELASRVMELEESMEQEPVFWYRSINEEIYEGPVHNDSVCGKMWRDEKPGEWLPLYAAPVSAKREWVELTEDEIANIRANCIETPIDLADRPYGWSIYFARAVVAALKEKNK